jgi:hypothetical protein
MPARAGARGARRRRPAARAKRPRRSWIAITEAATLSRPSGDLEAAREAFRSLGHNEQMRLARELVEARSAEITRAYADVISLGPGYRVHATRTRRAVRPEVCVTVVVKRKWPKGTRGRHVRRVPEHFLTHATIGERRVPCAVPTDVEDGRHFARIRPQAQGTAPPARIRASAPDETSDTALGMVACAITRDGDDQIVYAVSCKHVFGMGLILDPAQHHRAEISLADDGTAVARATPISGRLGNGLPYSFDAQLAQVVADGRGGLLAALGNVKLRNLALEWSDLRTETDYWIQTSRGPVKVHFTGIHTEPIDYDENGLDDVRHQELARFLMPDDVTIKGDSGAPVTTEPAGGTLLGMHIAAYADQRIAIAIPAWLLLSSGSYGLGGERWDLSS